MVGIAQQENFLSISDTSSKYLGSGWTNCTSSQEEAITIWHQLTMTSGLDDNVNDPSCTEILVKLELLELDGHTTMHRIPIKSSN